MSITLRQSLALLGTVSEGQSILGDSQDSPSGLSGDIPLFQACLSDFLLCVPAFFPFRPALYPDCK